VAGANVVQAVALATHAQGETQRLQEQAELNKAQLADSIRLLDADNRKTAQELEMEEELGKSLRQRLALLQSQLSKTEAELEQARAAKSEVLRPVVVFARVLVHLSAFVRLWPLAFGLALPCAFIWARGLHKRCLRACALMLACRFRGAGAGTGRGRIHGQAAGTGTGARSRRAAAQGKRGGGGAVGAAAGGAQADGGGQG